MRDREMWDDFINHMEERLEAQEKPERDKQQFLNDMEKRKKLGIGLAFAEIMSYQDDILNWILDETETDINDVLFQFREVLQDTLISLLNESHDNMPVDILTEYTRRTANIMSSYDKMVLGITKTLNVRDNKSKHAHELNNSSKKRWAKRKELYDRLRSEGKTVREAKKFMRKFIENETGKVPSDSALFNNKLKG